MRKGVAGTFSSYTFSHFCLNYVNTLPIKTKRKKILYITSRGPDNPLKLDNSQALFSNILP